jgi:hypothetical protein
MPGRARNLMPKVLATARLAQCVAVPGGFEHGKRKHLRHSLGRARILPGLRVLSRNKPATLARQNVVAGAIPPDCSPSSACDIKDGKPSSGIEGMIRAR